MKFSDVVQQASALLEDKERASYRFLKHEFDLDDEASEDLKFELLQTDRVAREKDGAWFS